MKYTVEVTEVRHVRMLYTVEANSVDEARELAENGETESEVVASSSVHDRVVHKVIPKTCSVVFE